MGVRVSNPAQMPYGSIVLWYGSIATIPTGWHLCNGSDGTPDLRNRFIVCADADVGGVAKTTIFGAALQTGGNTTHAHSFDTIAIDPGSTYPVASSIEDTSILPPFYALAYIMKI